MTVENGGLQSHVLQRGGDERSNLIQGGSTGARRKTCDGLDEFTASWWVTHKRVDLGHELVDVLEPVRVRHDGPFGGKRSPALQLVVEIAGVRA